MVAVPCKKPGEGLLKKHLQRLRILPGEFIGDRIQDAAVGIKTTGGRIEVGVRLLLKINQRPALHGRVKRDIQLSVAA